MPSTDFNGQEIAPALSSDRGDADGVAAQYIVTDLGSTMAPIDAIQASQLVSEGDAKAWRFKMRGVDASGGYTTWVVLGKPDADGLLATRLNTTPVITGSIVAGSGVVLAKWGGVFPDGSG